MIQVSGSTADREHGIHLGSSRVVDLDFAFSDLKIEAVTSHAKGHVTLTTPSTNFKIGSAEDDLVKL